MILQPNERGWCSGPEPDPGAGVDLRVLTGHVAPEESRSPDAAFAFDVPQPRGA